MSASWTDKNLGWAYIRYRCDDDANASRVIVPANFIKDYRRGDKIKPDYLYKIFWSPDKNDSPVKYLQSASKIPLFDEEPSEDFGKAGCYRGTINVIKETSEEVEKWIKSKRLKDIPSKLLQKSFELQKPSEIKQEGSSIEGSKVSRSSSGLKSANRDKKKNKGDRDKDGKIHGKNNSNGSLRNVAGLRDKLLAQMESKGDAINEEKEDDPVLLTKQSSFSRVEKYSMSISDDSDDPTIPSPRKVKKMEHEIIRQRQEMRKLAIQKERLQQEILRMHEMQQGAKTQGVPAQESRCQDDSESNGGGPNEMSSKCFQHDEDTINPKEPKSKSPEDTPSTGGGPEQTTSNCPQNIDSNSQKEPKRPHLSKRKLYIMERDAKRSKITTHVPIPESFDYSAKKAFRINENWAIDAGHMSELSDMDQGEGKDGAFVKRAAVMLFGSDHLLKVGCVAGITKNGISREGLDPVALEGIRVLLILRAQREGVQILWNTERTKQAKVNGYITEKIRTLENARLRLESTRQKSSVD